MGTKYSAVLTRRAWQISGVVVMACLVGLITAAYLPAPKAGAAALAIFCIGLWATAAVPEYWTALAFFLLAVVFEIAPPPIVFSGFYSSTFWLVFSGLILGAAIRYTGLDGRAATLLSGILGARYSSVILSIVLFGLALAFVMPSAMGRIVLLIPIIVALADRMGYGSGSNGRIGMLTAAAFGTFAPAFTILPANVPNMMLAGMAENLYEFRLSYWDYLLLHFPVLGALKAALLILLILWMFPDHDPVHEPVPDRGSVPMKVEERRLAVVLALCLGFWLTDGLHHISPAWIGLAAALFTLWPGSGLTSKQCLNEEINYGTLFFVAGIMGLGAVISATGLGESVVHSLSTQAEFSSARPYWDVTALTAISTVVAMITNLPGVPAVMTPVAQDLAHLTGLPLATVLMTQVLAFSNVFLPYQAPPLVAAMQVGRLPTIATAKVCLALFAITGLLLIPLDLIWWHVLGLL
ncbi:MAG: anion permease [Gammaproteobacteria bacterium]|nr:anion permease [Gammaproteobacteria bacterium]